MRVLAALTAAQLFGAGQHALGVAADSAIDLSGGALAVAEQQAWSVSSVSRSIKLSANTASATVTMQIENVGKVPLDSFAVRWSTAFSARVGHITASRKGGAGSFTVAMQPGLPDGISEIKSAVINLDQTAAKGEKMTLVYTLHMGLPYVPLPKEIDLFQDQWLVFEDSQCVPSPYNIGKQTTVAELPDSAGEVESFTEGAQRQGKKITWDESFCQGGKASITDSGEKKPLRIHFGHNAHQAYFKTVKREIEVSHWGNIAFTEDYKLHHGGAQMTGSFSRVSFTWADYRDKGMQTPPNPVVTGMQELSAVLPKTARNLHYRDEIGNISSSNARRDDRGYVLAQIRPRYPLLGGWNADWAFSYDVPTRSALKVDPLDPSLHVLNITMSPPIVRTFSQKLIVEVLLPEGAYDIELRLPKTADATWNGTRNSWLDFAGGRRLVGYSIDNFFVPEKSILNYKFQVLYRFHTVTMVYEPVILSVFLFIALLTYIFYGRLELRIVKKGEAALLDTAEYDTSLIRRAMETFDLLTSEFDSTLARADKQAKVPVKQKWQPYIAQQREKYTGICQSLEETLAAHSASETDPRLGKLKTTLQNYMDAQEQQIEVRSTTSMSPEDSSSSKSSKSSDAKVVLEHAQRCADLEVNIALLLRALVGQDDREKAWLQPVL